MKFFILKIKNIFGPLFPFFVFAVLNLIVFGIFRLCLAIWQFSRISAVDGFGTLMIQGVRVDAATIGWWLLVPAVFFSLFVFPSFSSRTQKLYRCEIFTLRIWLTLGSVFFLFMELSTPSFIATYDFRPNRLFFEYLSSPREVFSMLLKSHAAELLLTVLLTVFAAWGFWKISGSVTRELCFPRWLFRPLYALVAFALLFISARSTFGHRPLNPAMVAFSADPLVNSLVVNSAYSLAFAAKQMGAEMKSAEIYGKMPAEEIISRVKRSRGRPEGDYVSAEIPTLTRNQSVWRGEPKNLVIILMESQGARYIGTLGGLPLSPEFDKLAREGWLFENLYATGTRSVRGIEAVVAGFTPTPARATVKLGKSQSGFFTIAELLRRRGYHTAFIYGGEKHFDNMASFFYGNGFKEIVDEKDYENPRHILTWGVSDEDLFDKTNEKFSGWSRAGKPFFSLVFTSSNHDPFDFPEGKIELYDRKNKATRENAAKYADFALGKFFEKAKKSNYWNNTVFLIVADHDSRVSGADLVPVSRFRIPGLILGNNVSAKRDSQVCSQIDMPTTLLSLIGIDGMYPMLGCDLTRERAGRAMMQFDNNFAMMRGNEVVILRPGKPASAFHYDFENEKLSPAETSEEAARDALAWVHWGSLAYRESLHKLPQEDANTVKE